jgi:hypothetical protein
MTTNPTKIFIKNYEPLLLKKHFLKLDEYFIKKEEIVEIVSTDGLFTIENGSIYRLKPVDKEIVVQEFDGFELIFDESYCKKEYINSQIPYDNIEIDTVRFYYGECKTGKKSFLTFVIEGMYEEHAFASLKTDKYINFTPSNFYFLLNEKFDNILVRKELNVFLSMLK